jgi:hypothetical protein
MVIHNNADDPDEVEVMDKVHSLLIHHPLVQSINSSWKDGIEKTVITLRKPKQ